MEAGADQRAVADIDEQLQTKITADAGGGVVDGLGHDVQAAMAAEGNQAIAKIFAADQHEKSEDDDDAESADDAENALERIERQRGRFDDFDLHGTLAGRSGGRVSSGGGATGGGRSEILADFVHSVGGVVEGGALGQMEGFEFGVDVGAIVG